MKKILKSHYVEAELELIRLEACDVITTSTEMGDGADRDDDGWTSW